jgi:hypothetical protein
MLLFMNHCNDFAPLLDNKNSYSYTTSSSGHEINAGPLARG